MTIDRLRVRRFILYAVLISFLYILESSYMYPLKLYGYKISLISTVFISIAILDNLAEAVFFAVFTGVLLDLNYFIVEGVNSAFFIICSMLIYFLVNHFFTKSVATNAMFVAITLLLHKLFMYLFYYFLIDKAPFMIYFEIIAPEVLISTVLSFITYFLVYKISTNFKTRLGD